MSEEPRQYGDEVPADKIKRLASEALAEIQLGGAPAAIVIVAAPDGSYWTAYAGNQLVIRGLLEYGYEAVHEHFSHKAASGTVK